MHKTVDKFEGKTSAFSLYCSALDKKLVNYISLAKSTCNFVMELSKIIQILSVCYKQFSCKNLKSTNKTAFYCHDSLSKIVSLFCHTFLIAL